jgi:NADH-quinone oxidoreductase subunit J
LKKGFWNYLPIALIISGLFIFEIYLVVTDKFFYEAKVLSEDATSNTELLGSVLYTDYLLPFQIAAVILLVAIVSAIALTMYGKKSHKGIDPKDQIRVDKKDRIRIVKMSSGKTK